MCDNTIGKRCPLLVPCLSNRLSITHRHGTNFGSVTPGRQEQVSDCSDGVDQVSTKYMLLTFSSYCYHLGVKYYC